MLQPFQSVKCATFDVVNVVLVQISTKWQVIERAGCSQRRNLVPTSISSCRDRRRRRSSTSGRCCCWATACGDPRVHSCTREECGGSCWTEGPWNGDAVKLSYDLWKLRLNSLLAYFRTSLYWFHDWFVGSRTNRMVLGSWLWTTLVDEKWPNKTKTRKWLNSRSIWFLTFWNSW